MPLYAPSPVIFDLCPEAQHIRARCIDVIDLGLCKVEFNGRTENKHQIRVVWEVDIDGQQYRVFKRYTLSMYEKAPLYRDLLAWGLIHPRMDQEELSKFDILSVIGKACYLDVAHKAPNGKVWASVETISPVPAQEEVDVPF